MSEITGAKTNIGYENSLPTSVVGEALDLTTYTDSKLCGQVDEQFEVTTRTPSRVGCGSAGIATSQAQGNKILNADVTQQLGFGSGWERMLAQMLGNSSTPVEQTPGQGDYKHILTLADNPNQYFGTLAWETASESVIELLNTITESVSLSLSDLNDYVNASALLLGNAVEFDATQAVNNNADLQSLTAIEKELIEPKCKNGYLLIKKVIDDGTSDTALVKVSDVFNVSSVDFSLSRDVEQVNELTGGDCAGLQLNGDPYTGTVSFEVRKHVSNSIMSYIDWDENAYYFAELVFEGSQIGTGVNKSIKFKFPKLAWASSPNYDITDEGINSYTLNFNLLSSENILPNFTTRNFEVELINTRANQYLAV